MLSRQLPSKSASPLLVYLHLPSSTLQMATTLAIQSCLLPMPMIRVWQNIIFVCFSIHMNHKTVVSGGKTQISAMDRL